MTNRGDEESRDQDDDAIAEAQDEARGEVRMGKYGIINWPAFWARYKPRQNDPRDEPR